jgi:hypothetical protein
MWQQEVMVHTDDVPLPIVNPQCTLATLYIVSGLEWISLIARRGPSWQQMSQNYLKVVTTYCVMEWCI